MSYSFPPDIQQLVDQRMATGMYDSQEQLLRVALGGLSDYEEAVADIQAGIDDERINGTISLAEADEAIRKSLGFAP